VPERRRIVLDALLVRPGTTGVGRSILELTRALAAADQELDFHLLCTHPEMFDFLKGVDGWSVHTCSGARGGSLRKALHAQVVLPGLVRSLGGALLHSLQFVAPLHLACPSVVTVHDLSYLRFPGTVEPPRRAYYRLCVPATLRRAARIVTNSAATAADVKAAFPAVADHVRVTRFGTPTWVWERSGPAGPVAADAPFLFVGTLEPRKNLERLLRAYRRFRALWEEEGRAQPAPGLVLAGGRGWLDSDLRELIRSLHVDGQVELAGYCDQDRLWKLYVSARALLMPSLHEGFGFPILEAMAAGLPVLTADRGAMREVAGDAALLVDPESESALIQGLQRLADDSELREKLVKRGRAQACAMSWERTARETVAVYREVLAGGTAPGA
jgi:glycosyltransferase involved in cell wall biosynthesis